MLAGVSAACECTPLKGGVQAMPTQNPENCARLKDRRSMFRTQHLSRTKDENQTGGNRRRAATRPAAMPRIPPGVKPEQPSCTGRIQVEGASVTVVARGERAVPPQFLPAAPNLQQTANVTPPRQRHARMQVLHEVLQSRRRRSATPWCAAQEEAPVRRRRTGSARCRMRGDAATQPPPPPHAFVGTVRRRPDTSDK